MGAESLEDVCTVTFVRPVTEDEARVLFIHLGTLLSCEVDYTAELSERFGDKYATHSGRVQPTGTRIHGSIRTRDTDIEYLCFEAEIDGDDPSRLIGGFEFQTGPYDVNELRPEKRKLMDAVRETVNTYFTTYPESPLRE